jgi:DNA-binding transcriptional LysR family regulator
LIDIPLRVLRYFVAAADHGNVTAAARALKVSQPSVSLAVAQLEAALKTQVFVRQHSRGVALTQAGTTVLREARKLLAHVGDFADGVSGVGQETRGNLSIGCLGYLAPRYLAGVLSGFLAHYPQTDVSFRDGDQPDLVRGMVNGELEVALTYDLMLPRRFAVEPLLELPPYILVPAGHRLAKRRAIHLREIADEPCALLSLPISQDYFGSIFASLGLAPNVRHRTGSMETVRSLVGNGLAYSILTLPSKVPASYDGKPLVALRLRDSVQPARIAAVHLSEYRPRPVARAFLAFLRDYFRKQASRGGS